MNLPVGGDAFCFCFVMGIFMIKALINPSILVGRTSPLARLQFLCYLRDLMPGPEHSFSSVIWYPRGSSSYHSYCGERETQWQSHYKCRSVGYQHLGMEDHF